MESEAFYWFCVIVAAVAMYARDCAKQLDAAVDEEGEDSF